MPTVAEIVAQDYDAYELLMGKDSHVWVANELGVSEKSVRRWRKKNRNLDSIVTQAFVDKVAQHEDIPPWDDDELHPVDDTSDVMTFSNNDRQKLHEKLDDLLDQTNADPGSVKGLRINAWDGLIKNASHEAEIVRQYAVRLDSHWTASWPVVQQAAPVTIDVDIPVPDLRSGKRAVILPDPQIGYRFYPDSGTYDPFHDEKAIQIATAVLAETTPDLVVLLGDYLDLAPFGKYEQEATFAHTTQKSIDFGHAWLKTIRTMLPTSEIVLLEGNHDRRLEKMVTRNAMEAFGLRRADDIDGWPVLSLPHLLRLGELGVQYVGGYPAGSYWINDRLKCIHGRIVRSAGSTAKAVVDEERVSVIFGHIHRIETQYKTASVREGGKTRLAHTPGCLCRIDGAVPSVKGSTDLQGRPVEQFENWQQGLSVVHYEEGDGPFNIESVFINTVNGYRTVYGNRVYSA